MPVSHPHKTIFVHIPKTAGTSIEAVLGMHGDKQDIGVVPYFNQKLDHEHLYGRQMQHMTAQAIRTVLNNDALFDSYFKFTVVRNPWDRLVSALAWTDQKWVRGEELTVSGFDSQVRQLHELLVTAQTAPVQLPHYLYPQSQYIFDAARRPLVNFIGRYENLAADWRVICAKLGLSIELPARMKSHHRDYREYYSPETRQRVADIYALDINLFQYEF
jgi:chondroitin 4-sulfotransferase 11